MSKDGRFPLIRLALPSFRSSFGDLLNAQSLYSFYTRSILESVYEQIMWFGRTRDDYINFERTTRASYYLLEQGYQADHERVAKQLIEAEDKIAPALNAVLASKIDAEKSLGDDPDKKIVEYLQYYKILYERLLPVICAPIVYAVSVYKNINDPIFIPRDDGQIDLNAIQKMDKHLTYGENRLSIGLNNHVRNAFSHEYYTILDGAQIRLWDINPRTGDYSWGPEVWPLDQLVSLCDQLFVNCLGIICSILIYYMNYPDIISRLDFASRPEPYHLRRKELDHLLHTITDELGFYLKDVIASADQLNLTLSLKTKGIDQDAKLYLGYAKCVKLIKIPTWYEKTRVIDQLITMLYLLAPYFASKTQISINIIADDNSSLGELLTDFDTIVSSKLINADPGTIDQNRHRFQRDTIENLSTYIEKQGEPKYIGMAPTNDNT